MVDPDPGYRPRRAIVDPTAAGDDAGAPPAGPPVPPAAKPADGGAATGATALSGTPATGGSPDPSEEAPPLFRDEVAGPGTPGSGTAAATGASSAGSAAASGAAGAAGGSAAAEETRVTRPLNFRQRRPQAADEDATTMLPRTPSGARRPVAGVDDDSDLDDGPRPLLGRRGRLALLVSAVAAVVVVGLAIIYAVASVGGPVTQPDPPVSVDPSSSASPSPGSPDPAALLGDAALLGAPAAKTISPDRSWRVTGTQRGAAADDAAPACLTGEPVDGEPVAQQEVTRLLSSNGKGAPSALHQAAAYASPQDAAQAYAVAARTFGGCASPGSYIVGGAAITGLGDQAAGLVVNVVADGATQWHSIVLTRTGRVLNIADAAQPGRALSVTRVAEAMATVTTAQCQAAGGDCAATPAIKSAPPPLGGDVPGFLAAGDLPPAGKGDESWVATPVEQPSESFLGSQCETVNWTRTGATSAATRVYLVPSSTKFGLNDIVLTMRNEKAARDLVAKIRSDLQSCSKRQLTAKVTKPAEVSAVGASGRRVSGYTSTVSQSSTDGTQRYRVGIVSSGPKVAYTFLNPLSGGYDLTQDEWDMVAVRAGQRMTQVP